MLGTKHSRHISQYLSLTMFIAVPNYLLMHYDYHQMKISGGLLIRAASHWPSFLNFN